MTTTTEDTPQAEAMRDQSDRQVVNARRDAERTFVDAYKRIRKRKGGRADYDAADAALATIDAAKTEMARRAVERGDQGFIDRWRGKRGALRLAREWDSDVLDGVGLSADRLSDEEDTELRALIKERRRAMEAVEEWPDEARLRYEALVGKAAGDEGLFETKRAELAKARETEAEMRKLSDMFLPTRRAAEPGEAVLPRFLFRWLTDGRENAFDLHSLGLLSALLLTFANEDASLFPTGRFEVSEGERRIVISDAGQRVRLVRGANDSEFAFPTARCLGDLKRNKWVETKRHFGQLTITPGERMRKLFDA
jgi:hypothetical protein